MHLAVRCAGEHKVEVALLRPEDRRRRVSAGLALELRDSVHPDPLVSGLHEKTWMSWKSTKVFMEARFNLYTQRN